MAETEEARIERIAKEVRRKREDPLYTGRYPPERRAAARSVSEGASSPTPSVPGGMMRMPTGAEAAQFAGDTIPAMVGETLLQRAVGPLAKPLARPIGAALRAAAGITGSALGSGAKAYGAGEDVTRGALTGAAGSAIGAGGTFPFGKTGRGLFERAAQPIGAAISAVGRRIPGVSKLFDAIPGAGESIRMLAEEGDGSLPTLGQVSDSNAVIMTEAMIQRSVGGHGAISSTQKSAEANGKEIAGRFVDKFMDVDRVRAGELINDVMNDRVKNFRDAASAMYKPVDDALRAEAVPTQALKDAAQNILDTKVGILSDKTSVLLRGIAELPDTLSFSKASALRSDFLRVNRDIDGLIGGQAKATAIDLHKVIDGEMERVAAGLHPSLARMWRDAQAFYKRGAEDFNDDIIAAFVKQEPEDMAEYLYSLGEGKIRRTAVERLRRISTGYGGGVRGADDILEPVRGSFIKKIMREAADTERVYAGNSVQFVDGRKLRQVLARFEKTEMESLLYPSDAKKLGEIARMLEITQRRATNVIGTSGLPSMVLLQAGATMAIWSSDHSTGSKLAELGTVWILGPKAISWTLRDPAIVKILASNVPSGPPGTAMIGKFASQFTARMLAAQRIFGGEEVKAQRGTMKDQPMSLSDPSRRTNTFEEETR